MYYDPFPIGYPDKIYKPAESNSEWFGFIYCKVIPPREILPYKQETKTGNTKYLFGLCRSCTEMREQKCNHYKVTKCSASDQKSNATKL